MDSTAIMISPDGTVADLELGQDSGPALRRAVDGYLQVLQLKNGLDMWISESGKYGQASNPMATSLALMHGVLDPRDWICGTVVLACSDDEGETVGIPEAKRRRLAGALTRAASSFTSTTC